MNHPESINAMQWLGLGVILLCWWLWFYGGEILEDSIAAFKEGLEGR